MAHAGGAGARARATGSSGALLLCAAALLAATATAEELLVLKDGRRIPVAHLAQREGQVLLETTDGAIFWVPADQVVSPPLSAIPRLDEQAPTPATPAPPPPPPPPVDPGPVLVLRDGQRLRVTEVSRRDGRVVFRTVDGETFSVSEDQVAELPLPDTGSAAVAASPPPPPAPAAAVVPGEFAAMPDRWAIPYPPGPRQAEGSLLDPYHQNVLKGDRPILGDSIFLVLQAAADSRLEARRRPRAEGGDAAESAARPRLRLAFDLFRGQTAFRPRSWALRVAGAFDRTWGGGARAPDESASLEEAFAEARLKVLSRDYDFVSLRAGIQPFVSDFRGLLFSDSNLGVRLYGTLAGNRWQYNAAFFDLLAKDPRSELNRLGGLADPDRRRGLRVGIANLYRQDFPFAGHTLLASVHVSRDDAPDPAGPGRLDAHYLGLAGSGHAGGVNLSWAWYRAFGEDAGDRASGRALRIGAQLAAVEASVDRDWMRWGASALYATGDRDPDDDRAQGFDALQEASRFAGAEFSWWNRSQIPLGADGPLLKARDALLPSLRTSRFGRASFVNPGLVQLGLDGSARLTHKLEAVAHAGYLRFAETAPLAARVGRGVRPDIGLDLGAGIRYRPLLSENVVLAAGMTGMVPGGGLRDLYDATGRRPFYNAFALVRLRY